MIRFTLGINDCDNNVKVNHRVAVRAVILNGENILLIKTNKGDYKFPGGGVKEGESHENAIIREVKEEAGYDVVKVNERVGEITQGKYDKMDKGSIFQMISHYYFCEVSDNVGSQKLDEYEEVLGFCPVWVNIHTAIEANQEVLKKEAKDINPFVYRETAFLKELVKLNTSK